MIRTAYRVTRVINRRGLDLDVVREHLSGLFGGDLKEVDQWLVTNVM